MLLCGSALSGSVWLLQDQCSGIAYEYQKHIDMTCAFIFGGYQSLLGQQPTIQLCSQMLENDMKCILQTL